MLGIPAKIAGCKNICICTLLNKQGKNNVAILYIAKKLGIQNIYSIGGAQAIAALAYGTQTVEKVFFHYLILLQAKNFKLSNVLEVLQQRR
jgi:histidinol dehydrogenase